MKRKLYSLLLLIFIMCTSFTVMVSANTNEETTTASGETTVAANTEISTVAAKTFISSNKTVKVNKTFKLKTTLKLNTTQINQYTYSTSNKKIATVSETGVVKGIKKGSTTILVRSKVDNSIYALVKVTVKNRYKASQLRLMSALIYCEAGNQKYAGKKAVGIVVMNRVSSKDFPNSLKKVIYQRGQFTPTRNGMLNKALAKYDKGTLPKSCTKAAKETLNGSKTVKLNGKNVNMKGYLFFSRYVSSPRLSIGSHQFK